MPPPEDEALLELPVVLPDVLPVAAPPVVPPPPEDAPPAVDAPPPVLAPPPLAAPPVVGVAAVVPVLMVAADAAAAVLAGVGSLAVASAPAVGSIVVLLSMELLDVPPPRELPAPELGSPEAFLEGAAITVAGVAGEALRPTLTMMSPNCSGSLSRPSVLIGSSKACFVRDGGSPI